jgi:hypothetical protein
MEHVVIGHPRAQTEEELWVELKAKGMAVKGVKDSVDALMRDWLKRRMFSPSPSDAQLFYLEWLAIRTEGLSWDQVETLFSNPILDPQTPKWDASWDMVQRMYDLALVRRMSVAAANTEDISELLEADRVRLRDFNRVVAQMKWTQVDMTDMTGRVTDQEKEMHRQAYQRVVNHSWLNDRDKSGKERQHYQKEMMATALLNNGPQPRTREDRVWRAADKRQRSRDYFVTGVPQSTLIRAELMSSSGHDDVIPPSGFAGNEEPARFGRRVADRQGHQPPLRSQRYRMPVEAAVSNKKRAAVDLTEEERERLYLEVKAKKAARGVLPEEDEEDDEFFPLYEVLQKRVGMTVQAK